jgi:hypothetical protein
MAHISTEAALLRNLRRLALAKLEAGMPRVVGEGKGTLFITADSMAWKL